MLGFNTVTLAGNVGYIEFFETSIAKDLGCYFTLCCQEGDTKTTWHKVSAYGKIAEICRKKDLAKGDYVLLEGELYNPAPPKFSEKVFSEIKITKKVVIFKKDISKDF